MTRPMLKEEKILRGFLVLEVDNYEKCSLMIDALIHAVNERGRKLEREVCVKTAMVHSISCFREGGSST